MARKIVLWSLVQGAGFESLSGRAPDDNCSYAKSKVPRAIQSVWHQGQFPEPDQRERSNTSDIQYRTSLRGVSQCLALWADRHRSCQRSKPVKKGKITHISIQCVIIVTRHVIVSLHPAVLIVQIHTFLLQKITRIFCILLFLFCGYNWLGN